MNTYQKYSTPFGSRCTAEVYYVYPLFPFRDSPLTLSFIITIKTSDLRPDEIAEGMENQASTRHAMKSIL
jgi:hypothetical protein